jgi:methionyl-tRNA formyltransferase
VPTPFGCSIHWITPGIDDGPLLGVIDQPIDLADTLLDQTTALYPLAIPTLLAVIEACAAGHRPGHPQDLRLRRCPRCRAKRISRPCANWACDFGNRMRWPAG